MTIHYLDYIFDRMQNVENTGGSSEGTLATAIEKPTMSIGASRRTSSSSSGSGGKMGKRSGKRPGRKPSKIDEHAKLERSRQSARECRARKKLRYQYLEELVINREKAVFALRDELETFKQWTLQMDGQGTVPDALVKMIAKENMDQQQKQMQDSQRALHQQQQRMQQLSSSSSSSGGTSPQYHLQQQQQQQQLKGASFAPHEADSLLQNLPNLSPTLLSSSTPQTSNVIVSKVPTPQQPQLRRQMAIDVPVHQMPPQMQHQQQPQSVQNLGQTATVSTSQLFPQKQTPTLMVPGPSRAHGQSYSPQQAPHIPYAQSSSSSSFLQGPSATQTLPRVKSEPPLRYSHSLDNPMQCGGPSDTGVVGFPSHSLHSASRMRSASNPVFMISATKQSASSTRAGQSVPSASGRSPFVMCSQPQVPGDISVRGPSAVRVPEMFPQNISETILDISNTAPVEDTTSSEDNTLDNFIFQSSLMATKRTLSDTMLHGADKRQMLASRSALSPVPSTSSSFLQAGPATTTSSFDPFVTLNNLTTVHCFSATRTSNTPSPAPYGLIPVAGSKHGGAPISSPAPGSSSQYQSHPNTTPSSSTTSSPAPLSSLSSFLELSESASSVPSAVQDVAMETQVTDQPQGSTQIPFGLQPTTGLCSTTGLSASISEPIPEWYSFLADLHDGGMSLTSRHGASSGQGTPMALTPKPSEQPSTPDPSFMNVPNIIDDLLGDEDNGTNTT